jgi:signal transduction histidine kinase
MAPASNLESLDHLVRSTRAAGLAVDHDIHGDVTSVPSLVSEEAYRIVQEALTNALKYSTDGAARLVVTRSDTALTVTLVNRSSHERSGQPATNGRGLRGIAERVHALGGSYTAASVAPDAWMLSATLPLSASDA